MKLLYILLFISILSCNIIDDKSDTNFTKEISAAKKNWVKYILRLQTMYGFKLRMSKSDYEKHFDSLINAGISNKFIS